LFHTNVHLSYELEDDIWTVGFNWSSCLSVWSTRYYSDAAVSVHCFYVLNCTWTRGWGRDEKWKW
jgi:hypothetical protein